MRNKDGKFQKGHRGFRESKYSDEEIIKEGERYDSPSDFIKNNKTFYTYATKRKLTKLINYRNGYKINYYTDEEILQEGSKYDSPSDFLRGNPKMYHCAVKRDLCEKIQYLEGRIGNRVKKLVYLYIFPDNHFYVGSTYNKKKRENEHSESGRTAVSEYKRKTGLVPLKYILTEGYIDADDAIKLEEQTRLKYLNDGWNQLNKRKCNSYGTTERKWTESKIRECILTCKFREEIKDKYGSGLYNAAHDLGIWYELTKDLPYMLNYYNKDSAIKIASKYITIQEFKKAHPSLYVLVLRYKWKTEVFKHMINGKCDYILDLNTGIFYYGYSDAIKYLNPKIGITGLRSQLTGRTKNKTNLIKT